MTFRLFLDEDVGGEVARLIRGHGAFDVLTTQEAGRANFGYDDESQLQFATEDSRTIFTFNMRDYDLIAKRWSTEGRHHAGIVSSPQGEPSRLLKGFIELQYLYPDGLPPDLCMRLPRPNLPA